VHPLHVYPLAQPLLLALFFLVAFAIAFLQVAVLGYAYERMGLHPRYVYLLLLASLLGSFVNIPVADVFTEHVVPPEEVSFFGIRYFIPAAIDVQRTVIAVNLGGAVIPTLLSIYLVIKNRLYGRSVVGVVAVAVVVHLIAQPVRGVGIALPIFVPPLVTAVVALALSRRQAAPLAYVSGSLGTLIGADLLNLGQIPGLGAPVASIGGAGTFDGIFLTGVLAALLASGFSRVPREGGPEQAGPTP
jgi:uncharacterized membrane protein